jgi:SsrA-binding protein
MDTSSKAPMKTIAENRRAGFDYEVTEKYEAGIELKGYEVKSAKGGRLQIAGAHVLIRGGEAWLVNSHIAPYQAGNMPPDYEEDRARRLLLSKDEIKELQGALMDRSRHVIPLRAYLKRGLIKIELGLGRSRKRSDKREVIKKRAHQREIRQTE